MKRVVVVGIPERGHYHPLLGPIAELERRGVEVTFVTTAAIEPELHEAGLTRVAIVRGAQPPSKTLRGEALARLLTEPARLRGWIRELLVDAPARFIEPVREVIRELRPQAVAIDTMSYEGAIAAELEGVPWVGWATSLNPVVPDGLDSELKRTLAALDPERQALFARHGLHARFRVSDVLSERGTAVFSTEALVGPAADPTVSLVGPSLGGTRRGEAVEPSFTGGRPLVYVSFGSQAWHQPRRFDRLLEAAARADVAVLAAMGGLAEQYRAPNVRCVAFADQLQALRQARVMVTHGGANSVMEGLAAGVPLLLSPICNDQPHNAWFLDGSGAGRVMDLDACPLDELKGALTALCADGPERAKAARIAKSYAQRSGAVGAADLVWRLVA